MIKQIYKKAIAVTTPVIALLSGVGSLFFASTLTRTYTYDSKEVFYWTMAIVCLVVFVSIFSFTLSTMVSTSKKRATKVKDD